MRPRDSHAFRPLTGENLRLLNLAIPKEKVLEIGQRYFRRNRVFFWSEGQDPHAQQLDAKQLRLLVELGEDLTTRPRDHYSVDRFLLNLFEALIVEPTLDIPVGEPAWLVNAIRQANRPEIFAQGCPGFVALTGKSPEYVSRVFRQKMGRTLTDYLTELRMVYAARELAAGVTPILHIAQDCGYSNLSHFYKCFTSRFGLSPRKYRVAKRI